MLAFQRGQIVLLTHHFLVVRGLNGQLTVWRLSGNTAVKNVAVTPATQAAAPGGHPFGEAGVDLVEELQRFAAGSQM